MTIQETETQFCEIFPDAENRMIKTSLIYNALDSSGNKVPLEGYTVLKTLAAAQSIIERKLDIYNNPYYAAYPGELISVVMDSSANNGVYLVLGTQNPSTNGLSLHKLAYA